MCLQFQTVILVNDTVVVDLGFVEAWKKSSLNVVTFCHLHKKLKGKSLTEEQQYFNKHFAYVHSHIEQVFGILKNKIFHFVFHGPSEHQEEIFLICCVLYNFERKKGVGKNELIINS